MDELMEEIIFTTFCDFSVTAEKTQANVTALPQPTPQSATTTGECYIVV